MVVSFIVMEIDGSRTLRAANNLRCFTVRFTELFESGLTNSIVMGVA